MKIKNLVIMFSFQPSKGKKFYFIKKLM